MQSQTQNRRFLLGTVAHNQHVQNLSRALHEAAMLAEYHTAGVDVWKSALARKIRAFAGRRYPPIESRFSRRKIQEIPETIVSSSWGWEACRLAAKQASLGAIAEDWLWERNEYGLDRWCAEEITEQNIDAFMGVEFGSLQTLTRCKELGKPGVVAFLSPQHATRERWVDAEYARFPELLTPETKKLLEKGKARDHRRDQEARIASVIHCASGFTWRSLVEFGISPEKIILAPLGCPPATTDSRQAYLSGKPIRFLYSGPVSVRKGAHILLDAWKKICPQRNAELHFFGAMMLPKRCQENVGPGVVFHGPVSSVQIAREYRSASVLVFPTLCDGFGMVVGEAFANGLPVITTPNAGAADLIRQNENGWLVEPGSAHALAEQMQWCIDNAPVLDDMRGPAIETARQWTWAHFRNSFISQLREKLNPLGSLRKIEVANCADG